MKMSRFTSLVGWLLSAPLLSAQAAPVAPMVLTQHNDNARTGQNLYETTLNTSNVNSKTFGLLFTRKVQGYVYAQPLYASNLNIPGKGVHNVVFIATEHNTVYAFDADHAAQSAPLWQTQLEASVSAYDPVGGSVCLAPPAPCNLYPEIGITSTPVIDQSTGTMYLDAYSKDSYGNFHHKIHALSVYTGLHQLPPVDVSGNYWGTGDNGNSFPVHFEASQQLQRPAILLNNGVLYLGYGAFADRDPYYGWIFAYRADNLQQIGIYNSTPNRGGWGGIWQSGQGLAADPTGFVYFQTGNGTTGLNGRPVDLSDSAVKLGLYYWIANGIKVYYLWAADWFIPYNVRYLSETDLDLGVSGMMLLPGSNYTVSGGKEGKVYLLNRNSMGGFHVGSDSQIPQWVQASSGYIYGAPVYWQTGSKRYVYVWGGGSSLKAYSVGSNNLLGTTPASQSNVQTTNLGGILSVSANGDTAGTGIVWANTPIGGGDAIGNTRGGVVRAFDAQNVGKELWNSEQVPARDRLPTYAKFNSVTVAGGKVFVPTFSGQISVYGLLNSAP